MHRRAARSTSRTAYRRHSSSSAAASRAGRARFELRDASSVASSAGSPHGWRESATWSNPRAAATATAADLHRLGEAVRLSRAAKEFQHRRRSLFPTCAASSASISISEVVAGRVLRPVRTRVSAPDRREHICDRSVFSTPAAISTWYRLEQLRRPVVRRRRHLPRLHEQLDGIVAPRRTVPLDRVAQLLEQAAPPFPAAIQSAATGESIPEAAVQPHAQQPSRRPARRNGALPSPTRSPTSVAASTSASPPRRARCARRARVASPRPAVRRRQCAPRRLPAEGRSTARDPIDPPPSLPCASGAIPAATATTAPPLDPPGVREHPRVAADAVRLGLGARR